MTEIKSVYIPAREEHEGLHGVTVNLNWLCPICGEPRGQIRKVRSYDGSLCLQCDGWDNPCGHIDKYAAVRKEAIINGLNNITKNDITHRISEQTKDSVEIEELKQSILECRGLYKGFKIDETTANTIAAHLHHVANYRKIYLVEQETARKIINDIRRVEVEVMGVKVKTVLSRTELINYLAKEYGVEVK